LKAAAASVMRPSIFDVINPGDELVDEPFARLAAVGRLRTVRHEGFWAPMDTLRDVDALETLARSGRPPWLPETAPRAAPA